MGRIVRCPECGEVYQDLESIENLRDNDGICVVCNAPIEIEDWDRVMASYEEEDLDDVDAMDVDEDDDWRGDVEIDDDFDHDDDDDDDDDFGDDDDE